VHLHPFSPLFFSKLFVCGVATVLAVSGLLSPVNLSPLIPRLFFLGMGRFTHSDMFLLKILAIRGSTHKPSFRPPHWCWRTPPPPASTHQLSTLYTFHWETTPRGGPCLELPPFMHVPPACLPPDPLVVPPSLCIKQVDRTPAFPRENCTILIPYFPRLTAGHKLSDVRSQPSGSCRATVLLASNLRYPILIFPYTPPSVGLVFDQARGPSLISRPRTSFFRAVMFQSPRVTTPASCEDWPFVNWI